jgi:ferric-chelate reductase [NAD(P)H]
MDPNALHNISYGMYVVSSNKLDKLNGQIANTVFQITSEPATLAISLNKGNLTHEHVEASRHFSVSILEEDTPLKFIGKFGFRSGRDFDKFKDTAYVKLESGCPAVTDYTVSYLEAKVVNSFDCGTHTLFLGKVLQSKMLKSSRPMTYDYYHQVKRGTTPKNAPTFIKGEMPQDVRGVS